MFCKNIYMYIYLIDPFLLHSLYLDVFLSKDLLRKYECKNKCMQNRSIKFFYVKKFM
jgi:hypothetical protein